MSNRLGDYGPFQRWSGKHRMWGPGGAGWQAWFGGKVIDGLCEVPDDYLADRRSREMSPAAIGCVPWLTSSRIVDPPAEAAQLVGCRSQIIFSCCTTGRALGERWRVHICPHLCCSCCEVSRGSRKFG